MADRAHKTESSNKTIVHDFDSSKNPMDKKKMGMWVVVALLGLGTGYLLAHHNLSTSGPTPNATAPKSSSDIQVGKVYGTANSTIDKDTVEGVMKEGGIEGEGQFHLVRPGGDSQNVYLTSSTVDLSLFIGHKVKVWGATQKAQTAGWLMDVGKVQVES